MAAWPPRVLSSLRVGVHFPPSSGCSNCGVGGLSRDLGNDEPSGRGLGDGSARSGRSAVPSPWTPGAPHLPTRTSALPIGERHGSGLSWFPADTLEGVVSDLVEGHAPLPKDDPVRPSPDIALAQKLLGGWTPQVPLERGREATIAYFRGLNGHPQG